MISIAFRFGNKNTSTSARMHHDVYGWGLIQAASTSNTFLYTFNIPRALLELTYAYSSHAWRAVYVTIIWPTEGRLCWIRLYAILKIQCAGRYILCMESMMCVNYFSFSSSLILFYTYIRVNLVLHFVTVKKVSLNWSGKLLKKVVLIRPSERMLHNERNSLFDCNRE